MITWMQRHKKYLIVTIWISTIAFVGAGFVGWGQYSYGDKAGAVAKVGEVEITMGDLQKAYSNLYSRYSQMFQGDFDEERAKSFGLQQQALQQLTNQALVLNLAASYDLQVSDEELLNEIKSQKFFFKDDSFDKTIYKQVLSKNNLTVSDYEANVRKQLLIQKTFSLLPMEVNKNESNILDTIMRIADKINYKVLSNDNISVNASEEALKSYWENMRQNFMTEVSYEVKYIKQDKVSGSYDDAKINEYYENNKILFKDKDGKILSLDDAKSAVIEKLNEKATKDMALRTYVAYKKGKLADDVKVSSTTISASKNPFSDEALNKISQLSVMSPFLKPVLVNGEYYTFELIKTNPSVAKSYEEAKSSVKPMYIQEQKKSKMLELAQNSVATFKGKTSDFITSRDSDKLSELSKEDANEFLMKLFTKEQKRDYIVLESGKVVLYNILEQKLLDKSDENIGDSIAQLKSAMFNEGLIKNLQNKYTTEIFIKGL